MRKYCKPIKSTTKLQEKPSISIILKTRKKKYNKRKGIILIVRTVPK
jgi:hypothetical protein